MRPAPRRLAHSVRLTPSGCVLKAKFHLLCAPRRLAHFVRLTPSGCVSKAKFHLLCAPRRLAHSVRLTPSGCVLKALKKITFHVIFCFCMPSQLRKQACDLLSHTKAHPDKSGWALCGRGDSNSHARFMSATTSR